MSARIRLLAKVLMLVAAVNWMALPVYARGGRGGGGGGRGGGGGFHGGGGGGARPSMGRTGGGGGMSRPAPRPSMSASRPSMSARPGGGGGMNRPGGAAGGISRPGGAAGGRPSYAGGAGAGFGGARPSYGHGSSFPNISGGGAGAAARPGQIAGTRPGQRPTTLPGQVGNRPGQRPGTLPGQTGGVRPGQLPSRPGQAVRPSPGDIAGGIRPGTRPGGEGRPPSGLRPGDRPGGGGAGTQWPNRPGGGGDRPWIGNGGRPGDRPVNRPGIGNGNNLVNNRPVIGSGNRYNNFNFNRAGWGWGHAGGYGPWNGHWNNHWVNPNHWGWYHGCWGGAWGNNWYAPLAYGATAWGLAAAASSWGYGGGYYNPYYSDGGGSTVVYNYSQPVTPTSYDTAATGTVQAPATDAPPTKLDQARSLFMAGDYQGALDQAAAGVAETPNDPVAHEFYALCLFALGEYQRAASVLDSLLAVAPGMDWTTLMSLYPSQATYLKQFRSLEDYAAAHAKDPASHFVLAYHLLVRGETNSAIDALQVVVDNQPKDQVAAKLLAALQGTDPSAAGANSQLAASPRQATATPPVPESASDAGPTTDLTGSWTAESDGGKFELKIDENGQFAWKAIPKNGKSVELAGPYVINGDFLNLESQDQGVMSAQVKSKGADSFQFVPAGSPAGDTGLTFTRAT